jgi:hypothetical protein
MPKFSPDQQLVVKVYRVTPPYFNEIVTVEKYSANLETYLLLKEYKGKGFSYIFPEGIFEPIVSDETLEKELKGIIK